MKRNTILLVLITIFSGILISSCQDKTQNTDKKDHTINRISEQDIILAQNTWGEAIVAIGTAFLNEQDFKTVAANTVDNLYGYDEGMVLFKPTKASDVQFRLSEEDALSYFVGGVIPEDDGFAIQPWSNVRFENAGMIIDDDSSIAMGNYYFTDANTGDIVKVEFTFGYFRDDIGNVRINLHHSSLPYKPGK